MTGPLRHPPSRLRLVGLDCVTGKVRFVARHPHAELGPTDVAVVGGTVVLVWAQQLLGYDPVSGALHWSAGDPD